MRKTTGTQTVRAAIYARKSTIDKKREGKSVRDQIREASEEIAVRGWHLEESHVFEDDGISASRHARGKARPGYASLVAAIEAGQIDVLVTAEQSRASRRLSVIGALVELCADNGVRMVMGGRDLDPANPTDLVLIGVQGGIDAGESERTRTRVLRGMRQSAMDGKPAGRNAYGYVREYDPGTGSLVAVTIEQHEADVVRSIVARILAGDSMTQIANDLNRAGEPSPNDAVAARVGREPSGTPWVGTIVKRLAVSPAYVGKRSHRGQLLEAMWPPIVDAASHERVVAKLSSNTRTSARSERPGAVVHWLSGVARCGLCGGNMRGRRINTGRRIYECRQCAKVTRTAAPLEQYVAEHVFAYVRRPDILAAIAAASSTGDQGGEAIARLDELTARRDNVRRLMATGALPAEDAAAVLHDLAAEIDTADRAVRSLVVPRNLADVITPNLEDAWHAFSPGRKREIAAALLDVTVLSMNGRKSNAFDPETVRIMPRGMTRKP